MSQFAWIVFFCGGWGVVFILVLNIFILTKCKRGIKHITRTWL